MRLAARRLALYISRMPDIMPKQFRLTDGGAILFQPDSTNPLPGAPIGTVRRGDDPARPLAVLADGAPVPADAASAWLLAHVSEVLAPLAALKGEEAAPQPARDIMDRLYEAFGTLPRAELEREIAALDEEGRRVLRARKIRLGPVLVFLPALNRPASVRLRGVLWSLWNGKSLPAAVPPDGMTSLSVAGQEADPAFYRAIGYPVYGSRAVRVDMLDRLITAVYDSAKDGVFKARHDMAEWLGCPIADLYAVLEAMGHKKIDDPAERAAEAVVSAPAPDAPEADAPSQDNAAEPQADAATAEGPLEENKPQEKPELATFRLRRGKAYGEAPQRKPHHKPYQKKSEEGGGKPSASAHGKGGKRGDRPRRGDKKDRPREDRDRERVISAAPPRRKGDEALSPFAVLKDLKVRGDG